MGEAHAHPHNAGQRPDRPSAADVWRDHRRWVAAILLAHKPREAELDDLLQSVAQVVASRLDEVAGGEAALKPWLRTVAVNAARAAGRKASVRRRHLRLVREASPDPAAVATADAPTKTLAADEQGRRLLDLAAGLPEKYREPLLLRCVRGMSHRQIGEVLGLPESTIETRIARGRRMLRDAAGADANPAAPPTPQPAGAASAV